MLSQLLVVSESLEKKISGRKSGVGMELLGLEQQTSGKCVITIVTACLE